MGNERELSNLIRKKLAAGIKNVVAHADKEYRKRVTEVTEEPEILPDGDIEFPGPHSTPGQYPHKETGQGEANVDHGISDSGETIEGRFGVRGEATGFGPFPGHEIAGGQHLMWLVTRGRRKGLDDLWFEITADLADRFKTGVDSIES